MYVTKLPTQCVTTSRTLSAYIGIDYVTKLPTQCVTTSRTLSAYMYTDNDLSLQGLGND